MSYTTCSYQSTKDTKERRHVVLKEFHYRLQSVLRKKVKATGNTNSNLFVYVYLGPVVSKAFSLNGG